MVIVFLCLPVICLCLSHVSWQPFAGFLLVSALCTSCFQFSVALRRNYCRSDATNCCLSIVLVLSVCGSQLCVFIQSLHWSMSKYVYHYVVCLSLFVLSRSRFRFWLSVWCFVSSFLLLSRAVILLTVTPAVHLSFFFFGIVRNCVFLGQPFLFRLFKWNLSASHAGIVSLCSCYLSTLYLFVWKWSSVHIDRNRALLSVLLLYTVSSSWRTFSFMLLFVFWCFTSRNSCRGQFSNTISFYLVASL